MFLDPTFQLSGSFSFLLSRALFQFFSLLWTSISITNINDIPLRRTTCSFTLFIWRQFLSIWTNAHLEVVCVNASKALQSPMVTLTIQFLRRSLPFNSNPAKALVFSYTILSVHVSQFKSCDNPTASLTIPFIRSCLPLNLHPAPILVSLIIPFNSLCFPLSSRTISILVFLWTFQLSYPSYKYCSV